MENDLPKPAPARLLAVVEVDQEHRVQCQQPGCGHGVYAAVHVVEDGGHLMVLGSTCFAKRYGDIRALGAAQHGGRTGRKLTDEERQMLVQNTAALLAKFEAQDRERAQADALAAKMAQEDEQRRRQEMADKLKRLRAMSELRQVAPTRVPGAVTNTRSPWPWQTPNSSVALFTAPGGQHWVRVRHQNGQEKLVPWPPFPGWESALPAGTGVPDPSLGVIAVNNIVESIELLRRNGFSEPKVGRWQDVRPSVSRL